MHHVCIVCTMAYRAGVVGGSGYTGAELLRLLAGHPEIEVVHVTADSNAGAAVGTLYPSLLPAYGDLRFSPLDVADLSGLDLVFCALPHGAVAAARPGDPRPGRARRRPRRRLPAAGRRVPALVRRAHAAPELIDRFAYGLVELYRDDLATHDARRVPGCYPTAVSLALAPLRRRAVWSSRGASSPTRCPGVSGAGRGLKTTSLFSEANENVTAYGLLTHRHTAEMEQALTHVARGDGRGAVHAAPRADDARDPRHLLRAPDDRAACRRRGCSSTTASSTRTIRASSWSTSRRAPRRRTAPTSCTSPCASTRAPTPCSRSRPRTTS